MSDHLATLSTGNTYVVSTNIGSGTMTESNYASGSFPPSNGTITATGGYWDGFGWWHPYVVPQPNLVPYAVPVPAAPMQTKADIALEIVKMGAKAPKATRDKALKVLRERLDAVGL